MRKQDAVTSLGERLRYIREDVRGMSRVDLEVATGSEVSHGSITKIEQGKLQPTAPKLVSLATALNVSLDELVGTAPLPPIPKQRETTRGRFKQGVAKRGRLRRASGNHP